MSARRILIVEDEKAIRDMIAFGLRRAGYDVAVALLSGGALPEPTYQHALALFGQSGLNEIIYLVGHYCFVSTTLNGFAIEVPESGH